MAMRSIEGSRLNFLVSASMILHCLSCVSEMPKYNILSNRPGLKSASSSKSGLLDAPTTKTPSPPSPPLIPSSSASNWETIRSITPPESPWLPLLGATESNSSKKMTHGLASLAFSKTLLTLASDSPMYMFNNSGPFTEKKLREKLVAMALASNVLPVPGGP